VRKVDGNFAVGCEPGRVYPLIHIFQCMVERTDAIMNEVLEPFTFILAHPTVFTAVDSNCTAIEQIAKEKT
jgi:hypothetical protein